MHTGTGIVYSTGGCIHKKLTCRERKGEVEGGVVDGVWGAEGAGDALVVSLLGVRKLRPILQHSFSYTQTFLRTFECSLFFRCKIHAYTSE